MYARVCIWILVVFGVNTRHYPDITLEFSGNDVELGMIVMAFQQFWLGAEELDRVSIFEYNLKIGSTQEDFELE